jgi:hypothetical protein
MQGTLFCVALLTTSYTTAAPLQQHHQTSSYDTGGRDHLPALNFCFVAFSISSSDFYAEKTNNILMFSNNDVSLQRISFCFAIEWNGVSN